MASISVVIPVFNSEASLVPLYERLIPALAGLGREFEVVLVEDGSRDGSWARVVELARRDDRIKGIRLGRNYGQHNALLCGIRAAQGEVIVTIDDDLQNPPEEIGKLLAKLDEGWDVVYGTPLMEQHGLWRDLASRATKLALQSAMGADTARNASAFRAFRTRLRDAFRDYQSPYVSIDVLLTWASTRFTSVAVRHEARVIGASNYSFRQLIIHALNMLTGFSVIPLQFASMLGFSFTLFGIGVLFFVVGRYLLEGGEIPGFPFLASVIAIFSGAQLFALGIIGEYLARMHFRIMARPTYSIRSSATGPGAEDQPAAGGGKA
jgi:glycosyltransferase involved in cell wall biosynthesis